MHRFGERFGVRSGHGLLRPVAFAASGYAVAAIVWVAFGDTLPGGRWFAVHLFTVGILSNLVVGLSESFGRTLLGAGKPGQRLDRFVLLNVGALLLLAFPPHLRYPLAAGATLLLGAVGWLAFDLRRMRRAAPGARFAFVVRGYEHACLAFLAGAVIGGLLGTGVLSGAWYGAARLAHLHVMILGWGGLTLMSTVVFLGPAMLRTRMAPDADRLGRLALSLAAAGLFIAVVVLVTSPGLGGPQALVAAAGLAAYAVGAALVAWPLLRPGGAGQRSAAGLMVRAAALWFTIAVAADAVVIASGTLRLLNALGGILIAGVLGQAIMAALGHLTPSVWGSDPSGRAALRRRMDRFALARVATLNLGAMAILAAGVLGPGTLGNVLGVGGWVAVSFAVLSFVALLGSAMAPVLSHGLSD